MPEKNRYVTALGIGSDQKVRVELSPQGALMWAASKAPAMAGGMWAQWVYEWAIEKWPDSKRGPEFVGGVCVVVGAFALQYLVARFQLGYSHLADKMTDGMIGRISPVVYRLVKGMLKQTAADKKPKVGGSSAADYKDLPDSPANASLDNDREAIQDVAGLLRDSPETTQLFADQMFAVMKREGHNVDEAGHQALVSSMREAAQVFAAGKF